MIEIKTFQALDGDCIWLRYGENKITNIVIDVGYLGTFKETLKTVFDWCIRNNEQIDLLIITHTDSDHISGMQALRANIELMGYIKSVWFNSPHIKIADNSTDNISFREGKEVFEFFQESCVPMLSEIHNKQESYSLNNAIITVLSPNKTDLDECNDKWLKSDNISASKSDWDNNIEVLTMRKSVKDNSTTNKASIAFLFEYDEKKLMFLGDSVSATTIEKLKDMGFGEKYLLEVDLIKLAHHGSNYNFSSDLLNYVLCKNFLISSNGCNLSKETLAKIIDFNAQKGIDETTLYFNYNKEVYDGLFSQREIEKYIIKCVYAKQQTRFLELHI